MSMSDQVVTVCAAAVPVLVSIGGVIRCLVRILASVERATELGSEAAGALAKHIEQSGSIHAAMTEQLTSHHGRLSALEAKGHPS